MASSLLDAVKYNSALEFLEQGEIRRFDTNGVVKDYNLAEAVVKAMDEFPSGNREQENSTMSHTGQTQGHAFFLPTHQVAGIDFFHYSSINSIHYQFVTKSSYWETI